MPAAAAWCIRLTSAARYSGCRGIAVDPAGNAYVTGQTQGDFPTTAGALDTTYNGGCDAFLANLSASGSALLYATL